MSHFHKFKRWIGTKLRIDTYVLSGEEIVCEKYPDRHIRLQEVRTWRQVFLCMGVWVMQIHTTDGRVLEWGDKHGHLISLLQRVAKDKEEPYVCA